MKAVYSLLLFSCLFTSVSHASCRVSVFVNSFNKPNFMEELDQLVKGIDQAVKSADPKNAAFEIHQGKDADYLYAVSEFEDRYNVRVLDKATKNVIFNETYGNSFFGAGYSPYGLASDFRYSILGNLDKCKAKARY